MHGFSLFGSHQLTSGNMPELGYCCLSGFKDDKDKNLSFWICTFRTHGYTNWQCLLWCRFSKFVPLKLAALEKNIGLSPHVAIQALLKILAFEMPLKGMSGGIPRLTLLLLLRLFNYVIPFINILQEMENCVHSLILKKSLISACFSF